MINTKFVHFNGQRHQRRKKQNEYSIAILHNAILHQPSMYPGVRHGVQYCTNPPGVSARLHQPVCNIAPTCVQYCTNPPCTRGSDTVCNIAPTLRVSVQDCTNISNLPCAILHRGLHAPIKSLIKNILMLFHQSKIISPQRFSSVTTP